MKINGEKRAERERGRVTQQYTTVSLSHNDKEQILDVEGSDWATTSPQHLLNYRYHCIRIKLIIIADDDYDDDGVCAACLLSLSLSVSLICNK